MNPYLFVYGTLRRDSGHPSHAELMGESRFVGHGTIPGLLLDLGAYPGVVRDPLGEGRVRGELYRLHRPSAALETIDIYEGCVPDRGEPPLFRRILTEVLMDGGASRTAWVYEYAGSRDRARVIRRGDYRKAAPREIPGEARGLRFACASLQLQRPAAQPSHQENEPC